MAIMTIELSNQVKGILGENSLRIYDEKASEEKIIQIPPQYKITTSRKERKRYYISIPGNKPPNIPRGYGNLRIGKYGLYTVEHLRNYSQYKKEMIYIGTEDFRKEDFEGINPILRENINNIPEEGLWINTYSVIPREYLTGEEILSKCRNFDLDNDTRIMNVYEYVYMLLREKKQILSFERDILEAKYEGYKWIIEKKALCKIETIQLDNWPIMVEDHNSPTGYSLIRYCEEDFFDLTRLSYEFCDTDDMFGNQKRYLPKLYVICCKL